MNESVWPPERQHLKELFEAYTTSTGIDLTPSFERRRALASMNRRGFTAADVKDVLAWVKEKIRTGAKGYSDSSLDWRNSMADVDVFEERLNAVKKLRKKREELAAKTSAVVSPEPTPEATAAEIRAKTKAGLADFRKQMSGGKL